MGTRGAGTRWRLLRWLIWCLSVALIAARPFSFPGVGLDPSWQAALLLARISDIPWGSLLNYTYGPWGWLSVTTVVDRSLMVMSIGFMLCVSALLVAVSWKLLLRAFSEQSALVIMLLVLVPVYSQVGVPDVFLSGIFGMLILVVERARDGRVESWRTILPLTFVVALALQVKFSIGLFALIGLIVVAMMWWRSRTTVALVFGSLVSWFVVLWLISERSIAGIPDWLRRSIAIGGGYAEVQSTNIGQPMFLVLYGFFALAMLMLLLHRLRVGASSRTVRVVSSILVVVMLYAGLKTGFVREGNLKVVEAFALLVPAWIWLVTPIRLELRRFVLLVIPVVLGLAVLPGERPETASIASHYDWPEKVSIWMEDAKLLASGRHFSREAEVARGADQEFYGLGEEMVARLRLSPAQVDPFDASLIWAYGLPWRPTPIFQTYMNFTPGLDRVTTEALNDRDVDESILIDTSWVGNLDYRLSLWTSPNYQLAITCSWIPVFRDGRWEQWLKDLDGDRCGDPETISSESISANEVVPVPQSGADSFVVAVYSRSSEFASLLESIRNFVYKPLDEFTVSLDGRTFRQPRTFSGSPIIVSCPPGSTETKRYEAVCPSPSTIAFSESGQLTFERIPMRMQ